MSGFSTDELKALNVLRKSPFCTFIYQNNPEYKGLPTTWAVCPDDHVLSDVGYDYAVVAAMRKT